MIVSAASHCVIQQHIQDIQHALIAEVLLAPPSVPALLALLDQAPPGKRWLTLVELPGPALVLVPTQS